VNHIALRQPLGLQDLRQRDPRPRIAREDRLDDERAGELDTVEDIDIGDEATERLRVLEAPDEHRLVEDQLGHPIPRLEPEVTFGFTLRTEDFRRIDIVETERLVGVTVPSEVDENVESISIHHMLADRSA